MTKGRLILITLCATLLFVARAAHAQVEHIADLSQLPGSTPEGLATIPSELRIVAPDPLYAGEALPSPVRADSIDVSPGRIHASLLKAVATEPGTLQRIGASRTARTPTLHRVLIGAAIGAGVGLAMGIPASKSIDEPRPVTVLGFTAVCAAIGAGIGYNVGR